MRYTLRVTSTRRYCTKCADRWWPQRVDNDAALAVKSTVRAIIDEPHRIGPRSLPDGFRRARPPGERPAATSAEDRPRAGDVEPDELRHRAEDRAREHLRRYVEPEP